MDMRTLMRTCKNFKPLCTQSTHIDQVLNLVHRLHHSEGVQLVIDVGVSWDGGGAGRAVKVEEVAVMFDGFRVTGLKWRERERERER